MRWPTTSSGSRRASSACSSRATSSRLRLAGGGGMPGRAALGHRLAVAARRARHRRPLGGRAPAALPGRPGPRARPRMGAALPRRARRAASLGVPQVAGRHPRDLSPGRARLGEGPRQGGSVRSDGCARDQSPGLGGPLRHAASLEPAGARLARLARALPGHARIRSTSGRGRSTPRASSPGPRRSSAISPACSWCRRWPSGA